MMSLICLVVAIGVVSVQGTSIIQHVMSDDLERDTEIDYTNFADRKEMITDLIQNQFRDFGGLGNIILQKNVPPSFTCMNETCKFCEHGFCFVVAYQSKTDNFLVKGTFFGGSAFSNTFNVPPWHDCSLVEKSIVKVEACATLHKIRIMNGRICADLNIQAGHLFSKELKGLCM
ncbi:hypothetical protein ACJMK2_014183 [Sinanodonta woodiana]|uniref:Uncharacterized protein n=1 Tax=Sinanodonta woodiana TaxID=1069815 RepID=A0ABD3V2D7_SINWO